MYNLCRFELLINFILKNLDIIMLLIFKMMQNIHVTQYISLRNIYMTIVILQQSSYYNFFVCKIYNQSACMYVSGYDSFTLGLQ